MQPHYQHEAIRQSPPKPQATDVISATSQPQIGDDESAAFLTVKLGPCEATCGWSLHTAALPLQALLPLHSPWALKASVPTSAQTPTAHPHLLLFITCFLPALQRVAYCLLSSSRQSCSSLARGTNFSCSRANPQLLQWGLKRFQVSPSSGIHSQL